MTVTQGTVFGGTEQLVSTSGAFEFSAGAGCDDGDADAGAWQKAVEFWNLTVSGFLVGADPYHRSVGADYGTFGAMLGMGIFGIRAPRFGRALGQTLSNVDDVVGNPALMAGRTPDDIGALIADARAKGWVVTTRGAGQSFGTGFRMYNPRGDGALIMWTRRGHRHGGHPFWKVSSGTHGIVYVNKFGVILQG